MKKAGSSFNLRYVISAYETAQLVDRLGQKVILQFHFQKQMPSWASKNMRWKIDFSISEDAVRVWSYEKIENKERDNINIFVEYRGVTFAGNIMTPSSISNYLAKNSSDAYFVDPYGILIASMTKKKIKQAIIQLIEEDELAKVFCLSDPIDETNPTSYSRLDRAIDLLMNPNPDLLKNNLMCFAAGKLIPIKDVSNDPAIISDEVSVMWGYLETEPNYIVVFFYDHATMGTRSGIYNLNCDV